MKSVLILRVEAHNVADEAATGLVESVRGLLAKLPGKARPVLETQFTDSAAVDLAEAEPEAVE